MVLELQLVSSGKFWKVVVVFGGFKLKLFPLRVVCRSGWGERWSNVIRVEFRLFESWFNGYIRPARPRGIVVISSLDRRRRKRVLCVDR